MLNESDLEKFTSVLDALNPAARVFANKALTSPDAGQRLARMAQVFRRLGKKSDAILLARLARLYCPSNRKVRILTEWQLRKGAPLWHFQLVHDHLRNDVYAQALSHYVKPGMVVFEVGTGTGLLAMLAIRAGASHVYTCEISTEVAEAARAIIARNGMQERISIIPKNVLDIKVGKDIPKRCDLFVSEIVDNSLLGEGVLPFTEYARDNLLVSGAPLLPRTVSAVGALLSCESCSEYYQVNEVMGFDLSEFNRFSPLEIQMPREVGSAVFLTEKADLISFDLSLSHHARVATASLKVNQDGVANGLLRWLRLDFGANIVFENCPPVRSCWEPHLHIMEHPLNVTVGDCVRFDVSHDRESLFIDLADNISASDGLRSIGGPAVNVDGSRADE